MLKLLNTTNLIDQPKTKCGEIYCHSYLDFTIQCAFCHIKLFSYDDFLLHMQNVHFENNLLKTDAVMECSVVEEQFEADELNNKIYEEKIFSDNDIDDIVYYASTTSEEEDTLLVIKNPEKDISKNQSTTCLSENNAEPLPSNTVCSMKKFKSSEPFSCPECNEKFQHKKYLDNHIVDIHDGHKCTICDKRFRLRHHLTRHLRKHTTEKKYQCTVENCGRVFMGEQNLKMHLEIHTMEKTLICDFENCGKAFHTKRRLLLHKYTHKGPKNNVCDICGYSCRAKMTLQIHQRIHTGEKPFVCEVCQKGFISRTALNQHIVIHSEKRPYVCNICNAAFAHYRILQRHVFIHSDERTFKCKLCDSSFKQVHGLDGHMRRMHMAPKPTNNETKEMN